MLTNKTWISVSGIMGFLAVALGAFGAHALKTHLSAEMLEIYKTAVFYQLFHSVVLLCLAITGKKEFFSASLLFLIGIILFSFSLYFYSVLQIEFLVYFTPIGGIFLLAGWAAIVWQAIKLKTG